MRVLAQAAALALVASAASGGGAFAADPGEHHHARAVHHAHRLHGSAPIARGPHVRPLPPPPGPYAVAPSYGAPFFSDGPDPYPGQFGASDQQRYSYSGTRGRLGLGADPRHPEGPGNIATPGVR